MIETLEAGSSVPFHPATCESPEVAMNSDRAKGTFDEVVGIAKQNVGNLTGSASLQVKGAVQQVKGKLENALGRAKDAVDEANQEAAKKRQSPVRVKPEPPANFERSKSA
jgi:uncharacterized protein YjbJ (UPF0337 family)